MGSFFLFDSIQWEPAGDAVFVFSGEARAGDFLYIVSDYLGVTPADDFAYIEIDCGKGIGGKITAKAETRKGGNPTLGRGNP